MLSIQIPTIYQRKPYFDALVEEFKWVARTYWGNIEIIDNIGDKTSRMVQKRKMRYESTNMPYSVQWDDDDWIHPMGIYHRMNELKYNPYSVSYRMVQEFDCKPNYSIPGKLLITDFRKKYPLRRLNEFGFDIIEPTNCKCVVKTEHCRNVIKELDLTERWGEDGQFGRVLYKKKLLKIERYIDKHIYWYLNLTGEPFTRLRYKKVTTNDEGKKTLL